MSTNFYAVRAIEMEPSEIDDLEAEICNPELRILFRIDEIHIAKRSGGWKMLFDHNNGWYYQPTRKALTSFLRGPDIYGIIDEYGDFYTEKQFWAEVDSWNSSPSSESSQDYTKTKPEESNWFYDSGLSKQKKECAQMFGIPEPESLDFYSSDGLRFSIFTDFD